MVYIWISIFRGMFDMWHIYNYIYIYVIPCYISIWDLEMKHRDITWVLPCITKNSWGILWETMGYTLWQWISYLAGKSTSSSSIIFPTINPTGFQPAMFDDTKGINNITRWLCSVTMENHNFILIIRDKSSKNIYKWAIYTIAMLTNQRGPWNNTCNDMIMTCDSGMHPRLITNARGWDRCWKEMCCSSLCNY